MTSAAQKSANQANSQLSTGPKTQTGKATAALNSTKHGFRATNVLLPGEDPAEYEALLEEITSHFSARDLTEQRCIREMADAEWRLRRARRFQEHMLNKKVHELFEATPEADLIDLQIEAHQALAADPGFLLFLKYERQFQRQYNEAHRTWTRYQSERRAAEKQDIELAVEVGLNAPFLEYGERKSPNEPNPPHVLTGRNFQPVAHRPTPSRPAAQPAA